MVVSYFRVLSQHLSGGTEGTVLWRRFKLAPLSYLVVVTGPYLGVWEVPVANFPLIRHGPHRKRFQQFCCCACIRYCGNVFT
jgi:hypothetical protein